MKRFFAFALLALSSVWAVAQVVPTTHEFARKDTSTLRFDLYRPAADVSLNTTVIYVFGGGFVFGERDGANNVPFYQELVKRGYTVIAIDYRLGLKGVKSVSPLNPKPAFAAVRLATEDLVSATKFIIDNQVQLGVDTSRIVTIGSSAGAITVLQTDYEMSNRSQVAQLLPENFRYRGVVSLAGAVFSTNGKPTYPRGAVPTMMAHGTADNVVVYKKIQVFNLGMFGTDALVKIFDKEGFPYYAIRYVGSHHEVAEFPRAYSTDEICNFINRAVDGTYSNQIDATVRDRYVQENFKINITSRKDLYNGN